MSQCGYECSLPFITLSNANKVVCSTCFCEDFCSSHLKSWRYKWKQVHVCDGHSIQAPVNNGWPKECDKWRRVGPLVLCWWTVSDRCDTSCLKLDKSQLQSNFPNNGDNNHDFCNMLDGNVPVKHLEGAALFLNGSPTDAAFVKCLVLQTISNYRPALEWQFAVFWKYKV